MKNNCILYNVNKIVVRPGLESAYIRFSKALNRFLLRRFSTFYAGLQLYQNNSRCNEFYVIASYNDVPGINEAATRIGNLISRIYDRVWGCSVVRTSIFSFLTSTKIF